EDEAESGEEAQDDEASPAGWLVGHGMPRVSLIGENYLEQGYRRQNRPSSAESIHYLEHTQPPALKDTPCSSDTSATNAMWPWPTCSSNPPLPTAIRSRHVRGRAAPFTPISSPASTRSRCRSPASAASACV